MKTLAVSALVGLAFATQAHAAPPPQILNLTTGSAGGDTQVLSSTSVFMTTALDASDDAGTNFNVSGLAPLAAGSALEAFTGHPAGEFDISRFNGSADMATEGSAFVMRNVSIQALDTLSFDWTFYTNEPASGALADAAYFSVLNSSTALLANAATGITGAGLLGFRAATGGTFSHIFTQAGTFSLVFAVVDTHDFTTSSALGINNLTVTPVPEAETWAMLLAGLGLVGMMVGRNRRRMT